MAFIHLNMPNNEGREGPICTMDGWEMIFWNGGDYVEIPSGYHVFSFESGNTRWSLQETLDDDDCMTFLVVYNFGQIAGEPTYSMEKLDDTTVLMVRKCIEEQEQKKNLKGKRQWTFAALVCEFYMIPIGVVLIVFSGMNIAMIIGGLAVSVLGLFLFVRSLKKFIRLFKKH